MEHYKVPNSGHNRDDEGKKMGMWLFLFTEILLFGGLFLVYAVYRFQFFDQFKVIAEHMNITMGAINTVILIASSLTVALSITAMKKGNNKLAVLLLFMTLALAAGFLVNKYFEWTNHIDHGLFMGNDVFNELARGEGMFLFLYYFMTGLHGIHVIVGSVLLAMVIYKIYKGKINQPNLVFHENAGLYWHLVDLIWIYLFPLFYLLH
ncbi:MAG: cytochrome C oxidase subunit III [Bacteroidetes bacterium CG2_30_33_31]|nr:MAG: cytochrome C oxidase subunit III [Bacteroidetes bacterium CG2_30_33_31]